MNCKPLIIFGCIAILTIGCTNQTANQTPTATTVTSADVKPGKFQAGEHSTQGQVSVVKKAGKNYLEFDQNFQTEKGPDLYVILSRSEKPPVSVIKENDYISIARLQKTSGHQLYALPSNINLQEFKSVAIWCRQFNVTFGYAIL